jgi:Leucine-rich repeat (LRR) protein
MLTNLTLSLDNRVTSLDLSEIGISSLPSQIGKLKSLKQLNLKCNRLSTLPDEITLLSEGIELQIDNNLLEDATLSKKIITWLDKQCPN